MRTFMFIRIRLLHITASLLLFQDGCMLIPGHGFSEIRRDGNAGYNLGFEIVDRDMPVNWFFKTERVINHWSKAGDVVDFDVVVDQHDAKEGVKSLRYVIHKCITSDQNMKYYAYYPGFFNEFQLEPGGTYRVSFWVKNNGCEFEVITSAVKAKGGEYCASAIVRSDTAIHEWTRFSMVQELCPWMDNLRIEVNVKSPGVFQMDALSIERIG